MCRPSASWCCASCECACSSSLASFSLRASRRRCSPSMRRAVSAWRRSRSPCSAAFSLACASSEDFMLVSTRTRSCRSSSLLSRSCTRWRSCSAAASLCSRLRSCALSSCCFEARMPSYSSRTLSKLLVVCPSSCTVCASRCSTSRNLSSLCASWAHSSSIFSSRFGSFGSFSAAGPCWLSRCLTISLRRCRVLSRSPVPCSSWRSDMVRTSCWIWSSFSRRSSESTLATGASTAAQGGCFAAGVSVCTGTVIVEEPPVSERRALGRALADMARAAGIACCGGAPGGSIGPVSGPEPRPGAPGRLCALCTPLPATCIGCTGMFTRMSARVATGSMSARGVAWREGTRVSDASVALLCGGGGLRLAIRPGTACTRGAPRAESTIPERWLSGGLARPAEWYMGKGAMGAPGLRPRGPTAS
mmetsp:Transcript_32377/g.82467  ORF Transcript_32377/g.82467 Transcript_32377/m.82467 type:complete len:418 (-) Transcript_32377:208-1461(-)